MSLQARHLLEDLLDREIDMSRQLGVALLAERAALTGDSPAAVEHKAADKLHLLAALEKLEHERRSQWDGSEAGAMAAQVGDRWHALLNVMAECRAANEVNGHIIRVRQSQIRQLLDIVRGGPAMTYGPHGKTFATALRALARA